ncbi:hypothetical protein WH95_12220 [Kiloniella litopenaei]|uniref:Phage abortive infection protein n=1 Tax=Kiloniella litopenaei TaxID=1549748 RepID=A0A0M2RAD9_9PROT|nr:putative phage abortive infection protein [Kiloniella litopenaei]KKJ76568.1 hypothetical protein WH95_12220 [Kiloniella litopenaei]
MPEENTEIQSKETKNWLPKLFLGMVFFIVIAFITITFSPTFRNFLTSIISIDGVISQKWGVIGDFFGGFLNPIVSLAAFGGVIYTVLLQRKELSLQRDELQITNEQLKASAEAQQEQSDHLSLQSFENILFKLIDRHCSNIENMRGKVGTVELFGSTLLIHIIGNVIKAVGKTSPKNVTNNGRNKEQFIEALHNRNLATFFTIYLRLSYRIYKYIWIYFGSTEEPSDQELSYAKLFRAHFTNEELFFLFVNSLTPEGHKYKKFIIRYKLLDNFDESKLPDDGYLREQYIQMRI